ncbi:WbqC family protein [Zobellella aerophila]|uniref:WbqC family protein n=1 Tax=Zobellella aerophila TaxID=870480 RepID=A0ABP6VW80_9GAMM
MNIVITQSMFFPWVGLLEQIRLADVIVHYDDVQFSKGSFVNRVQLKTSRGMRWMTVPLKKFSLGTEIKNIETSRHHDWQKAHLDLMGESFSGSPFSQDAIELVQSCYQDGNISNIGHLARISMYGLLDYFNLIGNKEFIDVTDLNISGSSSLRVFDIVKMLGGTTYITGHGAASYLNHSLFEENGINVEYMNYQCKHYPQNHGDFTPYVSSLDLIANMGANGIDVICSGTKNWKDFIDERNREI